MTQFFVELPADEYGNTAYTMAVVEGEIVPWTYDSRRKNLVIIGPPEFRNKWPNLLMENYGGWKEVDGPARLIDREEWKRLTGWTD